MATRESFLQTISRAAGQGGVLRNPADFSEFFASEDVSELVERTLHRSHEELLELAAQFEAAAKPLNLTCHRAESMTEARDLIVSLLEQATPEFAETKKIVLHDHPDVAALGLPEVLVQAGMESLVTAVGTPQIRSFSEQALAGITAPELGMASAAALVQRELLGQPRSTSLLPSIHIALLRLKNITSDYDDFYARIGEVSGPMVFISGPSKTADIEAVLVHGAHGPKALHCILLDD